MVRAPDITTGGATHGGMHAETLLVGTQRLGEGGVSQQRALRREHLQFELHPR